MNRQGFTESSREGAAERRTSRRMGFVELHFHLLPAVDDGPTSFDESLALAAAAVADGTRTVVTTPHVRPEYVTDPTEIPGLVRELSARLLLERIALRVLPGGELAHMMVERLSDAQLEAIAQGPPGRRWVLLEAPFEGLDADFTAAADELRERGFAVLVAHPERAAPTPATNAVLEHELHAGSALQLTAWSFAGLYGEQVRTTALRLARSGPRVVIASDAHGTARMPAMALGVSSLAAAGDPDPRRFAEAVPHALLTGGLGLSGARLVA
jgi:protein-tyrosine phosphatase